MKSCFIFLTFFCVIIFCPKGFSEVKTNEFEFVGYEVEPFYFKSGTEGITGAYFEIMTETCKHLQMRCKFRIITNFREVFKLVRDGKVDSSGPYAFIQPREQALYFSPPLFKTGYGFYGLKKNVTPIKSLNDLRGLSIGVLYPSNTSLSLTRINEFVDGKIKFVPETSVPKLLQGAEHNNYPLIYLNTDAARVQIAKRHSPLEQVPKLGETAEYYIVFSKQLVTPERFEKIKKALEELRGSIFFQEVAKKYQLQPSDEKTN
ncbi:ABC transporter substrate-binding protein [Bdellovibrio sp. NC01]|uniref:substrate-binding periplasmic protein n=1 Tax=Bdellovibrio sp. NC01 TaxID=2220073 RepID=UPI00115C418B|nr:transporter substrate-binding domain-containing protein [Bdellovibrio sp. NC01]QDK38552.1 hypothetical protein DOE51_13680 [Bdellovibrio sp. NC01]